MFVNSSKKNGSKNRKAKYKMSLLFNEANLEIVPLHTDVI